MKHELTLRLPCMLAFLKLFYFIAAFVCNEMLLCSVVHCGLALISAHLVTCVIRCDKPVRVLLYSLFY